MDGLEVAIHQIRRDFQHLLKAVGHVVESQADIIRSQARIEQVLQAVQASLIGAKQTGEELMTDLNKINASVADLAAKVASQTTVEQSVVTLVQGQVASLADLKAQVAALQAGNVTQEQLDAVADQIGAQATALDQNTAALAAAVPTNTPAAT